MTDAQNFDLWLERFPKLKSLDADHLMLAKGVVQFPVLEPGDVAYREEWPCPNYVMCVDGRTRVFKLSDTARELLIYQVQSGGTCVLTTQCLLAAVTSRPRALPRRARCWRQSPKRASIR